MPQPITTRLRFVSSKDAQTIVDFFDSLGHRVKIYAMNFDGTKWFCWFVPPDEDHIDVGSGDLD